jgi:hypothetical protein
VEVIKEVEIVKEVIKEVEVVKEVEVIKEVEVEKEVIKEVPVEVASGGAVGSSSTDSHTRELEARVQAQALEIARQAERAHAAQAVVAEALTTANAAQAALKLARVAHEAGESWLAKSEAEAEAGPGSGAAEVTRTVVEEVGVVKEVVGKDSGSDGMRAQLEAQLVESNSLLSEARAARKMTERQLKQMQAELRKALAAAAARPSPSEPFISSASSATVSATTFGSETDVDAPPPSPALAASPAAKPPPAAAVVKPPGPAARPIGCAAAVSARMHTVLEWTHQDLTFLLQCARGSASGYNAVPRWAAQPAG